MVLIGLVGFIARICASIHGAATPLQGFGLPRPPLRALRRLMVCGSVVQGLGLLFCKIKSAEASGRSRCMHKAGATPLIPSSKSACPPPPPTPTPPPHLPQPARPGHDSGNPVSLVFTCGVAEAGRVALKLRMVSKTWYKPFGVRQNRTNNGFVVGLRVQV